MSVTVLATGRLHAAPERRTGASGKPYVRASLIAHDGEQDSFVSVLAFGHAAEQLAALEKGDTVAVIGRAKVNTWQREGETRAGLSVVADGVLTVYHARRKRQAVANSGASTEGES